MSRKKKREGRVFQDGAGERQGQDGGARRVAQVPHLHLQHRLLREFFFFFSFVCMCVNF